jgi:apolipoprotein N-acyltransferase
VPRNPLLRKPTPHDGSRPHRGGLRPGPALLLAAGAGAAYGQAFPPHEWWALAPVSVSALALAARGRRPAAAAALGLLTGLVAFIPLLNWAGVYVGWLPWLALATTEATYFAALGALLPLAWRVRGGAAGTITTLSGLWTAQEALRGRFPFGGFPWARLAFSQADAPTLGLAALGGAPLISAAVAATGGCLAVAAVAAATAAHTTGRGTTGRWRTAAPVLLPLLAGAALTMAGTAVPRPAPTGPGTSRIAAIQGNVPRAGLDFNAQRRAVLDNHATATHRLAADVQAGRTPHPDLVVWPENASDIDPFRNADATAVIQAAADDIDAPILLGAVVRGTQDHQENTAVLWWPATAAHPGPGATYQKRHPAPFAEYVPFRSFFRIFSDKVDLAGKFTAGDQVGVLDAGTIRAGDVICFEVAYDSLVQDPIRAGANLLIIQTNNATFGYTAESAQQLAMSRIRAVETGRSVVHVSTVGESGLFLPDGTQLGHTELFTQRVLTAELPLRTGLTPAVRLGTGPEITLTALAALLIATTRPGPFRRRRGTAPTSRTLPGHTPTGPDTEPEPAADPTAGPVTGPTTGQEQEPAAEPGGTR